MSVLGTEPESSLAPWSIILMTQFILWSLDASQGLLTSRIVDTFVSNWVLASGLYWFCLSPTQNSSFRALSPTLGLLCVWERLTSKLQAGNDKNGRPPDMGLLTGEDSTPLIHSNPSFTATPGPGGWEKQQVLLCKAE